MSQSFPAGGDRKAKHMARTAAQSPPPKKAKEDRERTVALLKKKNHNKKPTNHCLNLIYTIQDVSVFHV